MSRFALSLACLVVTAGIARADNFAFQSGARQVALIELFTSEGCSSCPPAEAWLSRLTSQAGLWKDFVPVAFHVDYWDAARWKDRFSSPAYTRRQRAYAAAWRSDSVYTPAFVINGREARAPSLSNAGAKAPELKVSSQDNQLTISYASPGEWEACVALLVCELTTKVGGGENAGKELRHDFVVVRYERIPMTNAQATCRLPTSDIAGRKALAVWITPHGRTEPVQATGGWLQAGKGLIENFK